MFELYCVNERWYRNQHTFCPFLFDQKGAKKSRLRNRSLNIPCTSLRDPNSLRSNRGSRFTLRSGNIPGAHDSNVVKSPLNLRRRRVGYCEQIKRTIHSHKSAVQIGNFVSYQCFVSWSQIKSPFHSPYGS